MKLYDFQQEDVDLIESRGSGAIGSEMGTGKTHEAIALDEAWWTPRSGPTLVVAPLNTFDTWIDKYGEQSPKSDVEVIDRKNRDAFAQKIRRRQGDVFVMHYDALRLMPELVGIKFGTIILDEAHRIANRKAQATRAAFQLRGDHRLVMSGTLSGDNPVNLWSPFHFLWPSYYKSFWRFWKHHIIEEVDDRGYRKIKGVKNTKSLKDEIAPWYVRHLKNERCCTHHPEGVMSWLPEKTYDKIWIDLTPTQRRIYEQMRKSMVAWVGEHEDSPLVASVVIAQLTRLSQIALATPEITEDGRVRLALPSAKIEALHELVMDHPDKKFLVFSSSKQVCYLTSKFMNERGIGNFVLSGDTPQSQRNGMVAAFNADLDCRLFIAVIEAGAEGIDGLQHATDTAVFLDRSWRTIKNKQAEDRLHRDGQKSTVQIIDIMARNTVDLGRHTKLAEKWEWIRQILGDEFDNRRNFSMDLSGLL